MPKVAGGEWKWPIGVTGVLWSWQQQHTAFILISFTTLGQLKRNSLSSIKSLRPVPIKNVSALMSFTRVSCKASDKDLVVKEQGHSPTAVVLGLTEASSTLVPFYTNISVYMLFFFFYLNMGKQTLPVYEFFQRRLNDAPAVLVSRRIENYLLTDGPTDVIMRHSIDVPTKVSCFHPSCWSQ